MLNLKDKIPTTLDEAINLLVDSLTTKERESIKKIDPARFHHTTGMAIRNYWKLWEDDSKLVHDIQKRFEIFGHADDCSALILKGVWLKVNNLNLKEGLNKEAENFKKYWLKEGLNPKTGKKI